ncbi:MAG: NAD-dependent epimerase/dehydratase family protein [Lachnospiraceae bacterium]|nr:NAD-dependent epimerase/dehydratase family protein [Lachnospiraceae bacterium]
MNNTMYLVTGAAGFLGSAICRQLVERGDKVRAFVLPNDKSAVYLPEEVEICKGDICEMEDLKRFFEVPEGTETIVLHIASIVTVSPDYNPVVMNVNVGGTKNIIRCCLDHPECKKLVYCSSTGAIPETKKGKRISEVMYFDEDQVLGCYSRSKAIATQAVLDAVEKEGLNACVVHPSGILGPEDFAVGETTKTVIEIINGAMPMGIDGSFNLCDVRDLAAGTIAAADKGRKGQCYILGNEEVSFRDFANMLVEEAGCKPIKSFLPIGVANFLAAMLEKQAKRSGKQPLMTTFSVYNLARNNKFDSSKARSELGYTTRSYEETIRDQVAWLKAEGKIAS